MQISIIIISFNTREVTRNCLFSIRDSNLELEYEIILVDNASSDGSVEMVRQEFPEVRVIANGTNNMFAKANNQGMEIACGDYFLLLNSDTIVEQGNIESLFNFINNSDGEIGCVGPTILNKDGSIQSEGFMLPSFTEMMSMIFRPLISKLPTSAKVKVLPPGHPLLLDARNNCKIGWLVGCCLLLKGSLAKTLGGFDVNFDFYCEDVDLCKRVWKLKYQVWLCRDAHVIHLGGASTPSVGWSKQRLLRAQIRFYLKHFSLLGAYVYILTYLGFYRSKKSILKCSPGSKPLAAIDVKINRFSSELVALQTWSSNANDRVGSHK